jgi:hypothetical protein
VSQPEDVHFERAQLLPGPEKGDCGCGCGRFGLLKRANRAGVRCVRGCRCVSCRGRNNRRKGATKQRAARKMLGIPGPSLGADHEELWRGAVLVEVKAGGRMANPIGVRYRAMRDQIEASRAIGDNRPACAIAMPDGWSGGVVMIHTDDVVAWAYALVEEMQNKAGDV